MNERIEELKRQLAEAERMWRQEREENKRLTINAEMFEKLYIASRQLEKERRDQDRHDCGECRKLLYLVPCPAGERQQEEMVGPVASKW